MSENKKENNEVDIVEKKVESSKIKVNDFIGENNNRLNHYQKAILNTKRTEIHTKKEWSDLLEKLLPSDGLKNPKSKLKGEALERSNKLKNAVSKANKKFKQREERSK